MTVYYEGGNSFYLGSRATIIEDERDTASEWASKAIVKNPAIKWILGRYVEADRANSNKQLWTLADLQNGGQKTIAHTPLNILHRPKHIVGAVQASEMLWPMSAEAADGSLEQPFIEALAAFWKVYFPDELKVVQAAHDMGELFFSMECISETITCVGDQACGVTFKYDGPTSPSYCDQINSYVSTKQFDKPNFLAAALIFPPARPGWKNAAVTEMASLFAEKDDDQLNSLYQMIAKEMPHLEQQSWENMMAALLEQAATPISGVTTATIGKSARMIADEVLRQRRTTARDFDTKQREKLAGEGKAMPDGSYPIATVQDLKNAIQAFGRAKNPGAVKAHIKKMAKRLGATDLLPDAWK